MRKEIQLFYIDQQLQNLQFQLLWNFNHFKW